MTAPFRCAVESSGRPDDLAGTASTVRAFLLVEESGPWGVDALRDSRLPVQDTLRERAHGTGVRALLVRRHGRSDSGVMRRVFAAYADPARPWLETATVERPEDLLDLDFAALGRGESPGLTPSDDSVFAVCTHGRHDTCCAERGRPVAAALTDAHRQATWEVSHIGGDRFAGNLLVLPHGLYYGRIDPATGLAVAGAHLSGHLDLDHLRGRSAWPMSAQAAEIALRRQLDETALGAVRLVGRRVEPRGAGTEARVELEVAGRRWLVVVRTESGPDTARLTCRATRENGLPRHDVLSIEALA